MNAVSLVVPVLNEAKALPALVTALAALDPAPGEILVVDGGSDDATCEIVRAAGWCLREAPRGRGIQDRKSVV